MQPLHGIFQLGYRNRYHHPRADVLQRYVERGVAIWRTDQSGAISIDIGAEQQLSAYRQQRARYWHGR